MTFGGFTDSSLSHSLLDPDPAKRPDVHIPQQVKKRTVSSDSKVQEESPRKRQRVPK
jgi:hypothetical protein